MAKKNPTAEKLWKLTEDRTVTTTPSFLDIYAPLLAMMYFGEIFKKPAKPGMTPEAEGVVRGTAQDVASFVRPPAAMGAAQGFGNMTPEQIMRIIMGMAGGAPLGGF